MKTLIIILALVALIAAAFGSSEAADAKRPAVLIFETAVGQGADKALAAAATKALRNYFRDTGRVEAVIFDRESPTVLRAIMEKKLTPDKVASYSSQPERIEVARTLGLQYAAGAEITVANGVVGLKLWLAGVDGGAKARWDASTGSLASGSDEMAMNNAVQAAASGVVLDVARRAFANLPAVSQPELAPPSESAVAPDSRPPAANQPAVDYGAQGDASAASGNLALAIEQYSQAINADPTNAAVRIKLAEAYARKGMYNEAYDELGRTTMIGADSKTVDAARDRIDKIRSGQAPATEPPTTAQAPPPLPPAPPVTESVVMTHSEAPAITRMVEGDKLWKQGRPDEAAAAYRESIKLNPTDWRAHERLAVVNASMGLFNESRKALDQLKAVQPSPTPEIIENRYEMLHKSFDNVFAGLLRQYDSDEADFGKGIITRESYYSTVKSLAMRMESMTKFLDSIPIPAAKEAANLRRGLASGLIAQAASSLLEYLETNNSKARTNADVFIAQAKRETEAAAKLEMNRIVVRKEPAEEE